MRTRNRYLSGFLANRIRMPYGFAEWQVGFGVALLTIISFLTLSAPLLTPHDPINPFAIVGAERVIFPPLLPPGSSVSLRSSTGEVTANFVLGTDQVGRDVLSRILYGSQFVMLVALISTFISAAIGTPLGLVSGYAGGRSDKVLSLIMDSIYSFPGLVLAIAIAAFLGIGLLNMAVAIAVVYIPSYFRLVRGQVLYVRELLYVDAARAMGARSWTIIKDYVFPNVIPSIVVVLSLNFADAIITEAGLTFIGLGIPPPTPDWGFDLNTGRRFFLSGAWWLGLFPGLMIVIAVLGFSLLGEGLDELINPRLKES